MLKNLQNLQGFKIHAVDGELGTVEQCYFDDESWVIRYLIVRTGGWLLGRSVLISPISVLRVDWDAERVDLSLTKEKVSKSPEISTDKPVFRQHEVDLLSYYGYPNYWGGHYLGGPAYLPSDFVAPVVRPFDDPANKADSHLRSTKEVHGYRIQADDGEIGHVKGFVMEDITWAIRYLEVNTSYWQPGKCVLVSPAWIKRVSWVDSKVYVALTRESIQSAPEYIESKPITPDYEERLYSHYGRVPSWSQAPGNESYFTQSAR